MKQNSSILFHSMGATSFLSNFSIAAVGGVVFFFAEAGNAAETTQMPPYQQYFDPAKGFKPAQPNFQKIFLQLAGSLEFYGSPEPYFRHVMAEHARIDVLYQKATGKAGSSRPAYFTDAYLENLVSSWNNLSAPLKLDNLCRLAGSDMRYAIMGSWNKTAPELLAQETGLSDEEKAAYRAVLQKQYFTKADFPMMEQFYKNIYDRLTDEGKSQVSTRTRRGQLSPEKRAEAIQNDLGGTMVIAIFREHQNKTLAFANSETIEKVTSDDLEKALINRLKLGDNLEDLTGMPVAQSDALKYSHEIQKAFQKRFAFIHQKSPADQAEVAQGAIVSMLENLVVVAHSEYIAAVKELATERRQ